MEKEDITEIEQDLTIDKENLDFECIDQPQRFMKWSKKFADAVRERDLAKRQCSVIRSQINADIRVRPAEYGIDSKVTEGAITATLEMVEDVVNAEKAVIDSQYDVNIYSGAKEAFDQRKSMLERLINLYISGYWSSPKVTNEAMGAMVDAGTEAQKQALRLRLKKQT